MKKSLTLLFYFLFAAFLLAQTAGGLRGQFNQILSNYILPVFALGLVGATIVGIVKNYDLIVDRSGDGTMVRGLVNVAILVGYALMAEVVLGVIIFTISRIKLSI